MSPSQFGLGGGLFAPATGFDPQANVMTPDQFHRQRQIDMLEGAASSGTIAGWGIERCIDSMVERPKSVLKKLNQDHEEWCGDVLIN